jgi:tRNA(Ile)-lysidine synthase
MLSNFITYIQQQELFRLSRDRILIAVSGGMDSVALVQLCKKAGVKFGIAHCNFQLRGKESDADAQFVQALAQQLKVPFYQVSFDTKKEAALSKKSIQVAARDLRYEWLEGLRKTNEYQYIAVGHHHNDSIETLLINLTMGCGIRGLHGILPKNGLLIRPLLFSTRADIEAYIQKKKFDYREDSSNSSTKYTRNALRHLVVPQLQRINPNLEQTFEENFLRFRETEALYDYAIQQLKKETLAQKGKTLWIDIEGVSNAPSPLSLLYEILQAYQFKPSKIQYIYNKRAEESGALYTSKTHQLLRDRKHWIVSPISSDKDSKYTLDGFNNSNNENNNNNTKGNISIADLEFQWEILTQKLNLKTTSKTIYLDMDQLNFPLHLRHWKDGDIFYPLGMQGKKKKLSKFFKDIKMNRFDKDATWLLCDKNDKIVWVLGQRADERFKILETTKRILKLKVELELEQ